MAAKTVTVYCGSRDGHDPKWIELARVVGKEMVQRDYALVFGGGRNGLMGALADAVLSAGGFVTGVIPESLLQMEPAMEGLSELFVVETMHTRKLLMSERADAFLVLPGGIGTFEEFFEMWTWRQIGLHKKPIVLLNAYDYYTPLLNFLESTVTDGFLDPKHHCHVHVATSVKQALDMLNIPCKD